MRWKNVVVGLALTLAGIAGCKQQCFLHECDYDHYRNLVAGVPGNLDSDPQASAAPITSVIPAPATVNDPERQPRFMSLAECIALALEQGTVGSQVQSQLGFSNDTLTSFAGGAFNIPPESIRVLALDPAVIGANIEGALAKFDARWISSATWNNTDRPVGSPLDVFQTGGNQGLNAINNQDSSVSSALLKPLPTGGVAGITFRTDYQFTNLPARVNPAYRPALQFQFEQPLLRDFGVQINQLRSTHPGSIITPFQSTTGGFEGILITRLRFDQQRADFERVVNYMLVNVEFAYWNLYGAYWTLYSREQALRQAYESWKIAKARFDAGRIPVQDFAQTRQQYELFRAQRIQALGQVLESERQLRGLLLLNVEDGTRLVPSDQPNTAPYVPDWESALTECLSLRPELVLVREEMKFRQLDLIREKNNLLPDLRFTSTYDVNGIGNRLDGPGPGNAFGNLASNDFHNWSMGLRFDVPIGFREAHTRVRIARLNLARTYGTLREQEMRAQRFLAQQYRNIIQQYELIKAQRAQREAAAIQLEARFKQFLAGQGTLDILLESQRVWSDALRDEFNALASYNAAMAGFEFAKGTIQRHDNVYVAEGPLPQCAQVRAVEHERMRAKGLILKERAIPEGACDTLPGLPETNGTKPLPLPLVMKNEPVKEWDWLPKMSAGEPPLNNGVMPAGMPMNSTPRLPATTSSSMPQSLPAMASTTSMPATTAPMINSRGNLPPALPPTQGMLIEEAPTPSRMETIKQRIFPSRSND